jgi:hypothetical protein
LGRGAFVRMGLALPASGSLGMKLIGIDGRYGIVAL